MRKLLFTSKLILWMLLLMAFAQNEGTGILRGRVYDAATKEAIPFANIVLEMNGQQKGFGETDDSGIYTIQPIPPGIYELKVSYLGYKPVVMKGVMITADKITYKDFAMNSAVETLKDVVVTSFRMVEADKTSSGSTITRDEISHVSSKKSKYASLSVGVKNDVTSISGARDYSTVYYIDGVAVQNNFSPDLGNEEYKSPNENKFIKVMNEPLSTFSIDVDKASYSNVRRFITDGTLPPSEAVRIEEMINYFDYDYPDPAGEDPFSINTEISECPWNNGHQLIHIGLQGKKIEWDQVPPNNLVFLIDVSGSMTATDKLPLLKWCFRLLVEQLREEDRVAIVVYAGNAGEVLSSTSGNKKEKILQAIDDLEAGGSTAGGAGIDLAYKIAKENFRANGNNRVILATDGDFNVGVSSDDELQKLIEGKRSEGIFLTVLGFGTGNYKDSKMEMLADKGNGNYAYVDNILEGQKIFVKELGATLFTIAKDVKLQVEFNPAKVKAYRLIGYENRMLNKEDFNDDKKDAGELGAGHTVTALYEIIPADSKEEIASVDSLRYQSLSRKQEVSLNNEILTVKFRYKKPDEAVSKVILHPLTDTEIPLMATTENFRFAAAVAEFGMLLRDSEFKNTSNYDQVLTMARGSKGAGSEGYRSEFIKLVETVKLMKESEKISMKD